MGGALLIDDSYNANPDSVRAAIDVLAATPGRKILVLGDMGEIGGQAGQFHDEIGGYAKSQGLDLLFALGEHSELDGLALCQRIKRRMPAANGKAPLVVLVTASNDPTDRVRGTLAGADGHIGKPLDVAALDPPPHPHRLGPVRDPAGPRSPRRVGLPPG